MRLRQRVSWLPQCEAAFKNIANENACCIFDSALYRKLDAEEVLPQEKAALHELPMATK
jgi:hypothetical protein